MLVFLNLETGMDACYLSIKMSAVLMAISIYKDDSVCRTGSRYIYKAYINNDLNPICCRYKMKPLIQLIDDGNHSCNLP